MNDKENELYRILDITISCCTFEDFPITREDISRRGYSEMPPKVMRMYDGGGMSRY